MCAALGFDGAWSGSLLPTFRDNPSVLTSRVQQSLEDGTDRLSRNVGRELPFYAAQKPKTAHIRRRTLLLVYIHVTVHRNRFLFK